MKVVQGIIWLSFICQLQGQPKTLPWNQLLKSTPALEAVYKDSTRLQLQIIVDVVSNTPTKQRTRYSFQDKPLQYFYPASLVKLPTAIFACERINTIGTAIGLDTPLQVSAHHPCQKTLLTDAFTAHGKPTLGSLLRKSLTISDNAAYSRLFEWVTPAYYEKRFTELQMPYAAVRVKFDGCSVDESRCSTRFSFYQDDTLVYEQPDSCYKEKYVAPMQEMCLLKPVKEGKKTNFIYRDFSYSNCIPLGDVHELMVALCRPEWSSLKLQLTNEQRDYLITSMQKPPGELYHQWKKDIKLHPHYYNFLFYGHDAAKHIDQLKITNIVGLAHGYAAESAMVEDQSGTTFFISAKLLYSAYQHTNKSESLFSEVAMPFLRDLGLQLYQWIKNNSN